MMLQRAVVFGLVGLCGCAEEATVCVEKPYPPIEPGSGYPEEAKINGCDVVQGTLDAAPNELDPVYDVFVLELTKGTRVTAYATDRDAETCSAPIPALVLSMGRTQSDQQPPREDRCPGFSTEVVGTNQFVLNVRGFNREAVPYDLHLEVE